MLGLPLVTQALEPIIDGLPNRSSGIERITVAFATTSAVGMTSSSDRRLDPASTVITVGIKLDVDPPGDQDGPALVPRWAAVSRD
jgi:hypothetical protein